jgi:L-fuconolactonase
MRLTCPATPSAAVLVSLAAASAASAAAPGEVQDGTRAAGNARRAGRGRPIVDTHIHFYQVTRAAGVPWPSPKNQRLYRDVLPAEYKALAQRHGIIASGIVEASPLDEDNQALLDLVRGDRFFPFYIAQLDIDAGDFPAKLDRLARDRRVVGIRAFLWNAEITLDETQRAHLRALATRGMTLDIISRGTKNPKDRVSALAAAVPELRIVINHLGGAKGERPTPEWELEIRRLADLHRNVYVKFSSFFDMYAPATGEDASWEAPAPLAAYRAHFDVLMSAFGEDRLVWGSNWPVSDLGGDFGRQIQIAEEYLASFGTRVRDKVMYKNALTIYRRQVPNR